MSSALNLVTLNRLRMKLLSLTLGIARYEGGREVHSSREETISFPTSADEITMRQWMDYQLALARAPEFIRAVRDAAPDERNALIEAWGAEQWSGFILNIADLLACVVDEKSGPLLRMLPATGENSDSLMSLYSDLNAVISGYTPKHRESFDWNGATYVWPTKVVDLVGREWFGQELTTAQSVDSLQIEHVYNAKDSAGQFAIEDRVYHVDVALCAILSRKVLKNGDIEEPPLDYNARMKHMERRIAEFKDLPMSVCLDMGFFLTSSKIASALTRISSMLSPHTSTA